MYDKQFFFFYQLGFKLVLKIMQRDLRGRNRIVVAIYNYICNQHLSPLMLWVLLRFITCLLTNLKHFFSTYFNFTKILVFFMARGKITYLHRNTFVEQDAKDVLGSAITNCSRIRIHLHKHCLPNKLWRTASYSHVENNGMTSSFH